MSTSLRGYCIKLSDLRALVKNPPAGLLEEFDQRFPNPFVAPKRRSKGSPGKPLKELLKTDTEGRLLEKMCAVRGVKIESSCFEDAKLTYVYKALDAGMGGGVCERLKEPRLPLPLPPNDGGPPWISYLTREEIEAGLRAPDEDDSGLDNDVLDARDDLRVWLETAREHGTDLVVFGT